jgi:multiple sugar transport system ATP-binding protein
MAQVELTGITKEFPGGVRAVDELNLTVGDGEFMVLVGPSGCGKTTVLRMTAGLEAITKGTIAIDGRVVNSVPSAKRDVAMVFQTYALYPHMTVFENLAFGLQQRKVSRKEVRGRVTEIARLLELEPFLNRKPRALSGGQRQRVAMGRAIVRRPSVFLMDEPLSNLDAKLRTQMRAEIRSLQRELGVTTIYVTHDQIEAMTMGDRVAVMRKGVLQQAGPPHELYRRPANLFVGGFIGSPAMNLVEGAVASGVLRLGSYQLPAHGLPDGRVGVGIRPEDVRVTPDGLPGRVLDVEDLGAEAIVHVETDLAHVLTEEVRETAADVDAAPLPTPAAGQSRQRSRVVVRVTGGSGLRVGENVALQIDETRLHLFDLETGVTLGEQLEQAGPRNGEGRDAGRELGGLVA